MSTLNQNRTHVNALIGQLHANKTPVVKVVSVDPTTNRGFARVVATITKSTVKDGAHALSAIASKLGNKMRIVPESFSVLASDAINVTLTGILSANPESVAYSEGLPGFRAVAGNMFLDDSDNAWTLQKTVAGDVLIRARTREDDDIISDVMQSVSSAGVGTSSAAGLQNYQAIAGNLNKLSGGDFVVYVDPNREEVVFGAVAAAVVEDGKSEKLCVVANGDTEHTIIDRKLVLALASDVEFNDEGLMQESTSAAGHSIEEIISYYSRMFQRDPSYFEKFISRWKQHSFQ